MSDPAAAPTRSLDLHCDHCGRAVRETRHTRTSYRVDYFGMHTGPVEEAWFKTDDGEAVPYLRLVAAVELATCVDCYAKPEVQLARERKFRPERDPGATGGPAP